MELNNLQEKSYAVCTCVIGAAKQSQFPPPCRSGDRRSQGTKRAKQSQFAAMPQGTGVGGRAHGGLRIEYTVAAEPPGRPAAQLYKQTQLATGALAVSNKTRPTKVGISRTDP